MLKRIDIIRAYIFCILFAGILPYLVIVILLAIESTRATAEVMDWIFKALFPNYNMGKGIGDIFTNYQYLDLCFNVFPEGVKMDPGKESLDTICEGFAAQGIAFACCKGKPKISMVEFSYFIHHREGGIRQK